MTVVPVRPLTAAEAAVRMELAPQPGHLLKPNEVVQPPQVVAPQAGVLDNIGLRTPPGTLASKPGRPPETQTLAQTVRIAAQTSAALQGGLAPLLAELGQVLRMRAIPASLKAAVAEALAAQRPLPPQPSAGEVQAAFARSGVFLEARLAAILAPQSGQPALSARAARTAVAAQLAPGVDAKAALLSLRETLKGWLADNGHPAGASATLSQAAQPPTPPYRAGPTRGQPPASPALPRDAPVEAVALRLIHSATAALAREELLQIASIPDASPGVPKGVEGQRWMLEIPIATSQGPAVAQFEVTRDGHRAGGGEDQPPVWRARFSIDVEPLGPVHAHVVLKPGRTSVTLWAERDATAAMLRAQGRHLSQALMRTDMAAEVAVIVGTPKAQVAEPGQFLDHAT